MRSNEPVNACAVRRSCIIHYDEHGTAEVNLLAFLLISFFTYLVIYSFINVLFIDLFAYLFVINKSKCESYKLVTDFIGSNDNRSSAMTKTRTKRFSEDTAQLPCQNL